MGASGTTETYLAQCLIAMVIVGSGTSLKCRFHGARQFSRYFAIPVSVVWLLLCNQRLKSYSMVADGMATSRPACSFG